MADRGLAYGDGLFETLRVVAGRAPLADLHGQRLVASAKRLGLPCDAAQWQQGLDQMLAAHTGQDGIIKLIFSAGDGGRGYGRPAVCQPRWQWAWHPYAARPARWYQQGMVLALSDVRLADQPHLAGMKHLNRLEQVLSRHAMPAGVDEVLVSDGLGRPLSLSCMNLYARFGDSLWTPDIKRAGVAGVIRRLVLERWVSDSGLSVSEQPCSMERLLEADEVFASNALAGVVPVCKLGTHVWSVGEAGRHFAACYRQVMGS